VNSDSTSATDHNGNTAVNAASLTVVGNDPNAADLNPGHTHVGVAPLTPPMSMDIATPSPCNITSSLTTITTANQASVSGSTSNPVVCFTNAVTVNSGVVLPGIAGSGVQYVFQNGVTLGAAKFGSATYSNGQFTNTLGATVVLAGGSMSQSNSQLSIFAPTSGTYNSIALMIPTSNSTFGAKCPASKISPCMRIQKGDSGSTFDGIIYAPGSYLEIQDTAGGGVNATGLVARGLFAKGNGTLYISNYSASNPITTPFKVITLVE